MTAGTAARGGLRRDIAAISIGHGLFALGQWVIGAALAKLAGVEAMAAFGLALAVSNPIYFLANMALRTALARDAAGEFALADYVRARIASTAAAFVAMAAAALTVGLERGADGAAALLLFACVKSADAGFDLIYGQRQRDGEAAKVTVSLAFRSTLGPAAVVAGLLLTDGALWAGLAAWAAAATLLFLALEAPGLVRRVRGTGGAGAMAVVARAWPLGVGAALASLETAIPRYAIEWLMPPEALGYFTAVFMFFAAAQIVASAFGSAATPHLGRAHAAGDRRRFRRMVVLLCLFGAGLGAVGVAVAWALGGWALGVIYTPAYSAYADVLTLTMVGAGLRFVASFLQFALVAAGRFKTHMAIHAGLAAMAAGAAPPLAAAYGLAGAALALIIVGIAQVVVLAGLLAR